MPNRHLSPIRALAALGLAAASSGAQAQVTLALSSWVPPSHPLTIAQAEWCNEISKATQGRILCNVLPKPVSAPPATLDAVRDGLADVSFSTHGYTPGRYVLTKVAEFPFLGKSCTANSVAYQRIYEKYLAKFDEHRGLHVITMFTHGPGAILNTKRPITKISDMDGLKFRVGGGTVNDIGKALGVNMTLKPAPQSYELLSSGVMDGVWFPDEAIISFKLEKVIKYRTAVPGGLYNTSMVMVMNPATWAKLSKEDQAIVNKFSGEWAARHIGKYWDAQDIRARAVAQAAGIESVEANDAFVADFKERVAPLEAAWVKEAQARGLKNAAEVLQAFRDEVKKLQ